MTYREMAMDAGCSSEDEINQMAQMLEWEEQAHYEQWAREQWELDELFKELHCTCDVCRGGGECPDRELF